MLRSYMVALAVLAAFLVSVTLQGCGDSGATTSKGPTQTTMTTIQVTTTTVTTITTTKSLIPPAAPNSSMSKLVPLRAISYKSKPVKQVEPPALPSEDMMQIGYENQWGPKGRDDLGQIKELGANAVRVYHAFGLEYLTDHGAFLDHAYALGLHVIVGMHSNNLCPDFNCYQTWYDSITNSSKVGFIKNGSWHPAIAMIVILDSPDILNFWESQGEQTKCKDSDGEAKCRVRASLSAMHGFLQAEKDLNIKSSVNLTISWTFVIKTSIDGVVKDGEGYYGFQDMLAGVAKPSLAGYKCSSDCQSMLSDAFDKRWIHSISAGSTWDYIKGKIDANYAAYAPKPWFIAEFTATDSTASVDQELQEINTAASAEGSLFRGVSFSDYQHDYQSGSAQGLYGLGEKELGQSNPCNEDIFTKDKQCRAFPVFCLDAKAGDNGRADLVAKAWEGTSKGHGMCLNEKENSMEEQIVF